MDIATTSSCYVSHCLEWPKNKIRNRICWRSRLGFQLLILCLVDQEMSYNWEDFKRGCKTLRVPQICGGTTVASIPYTVHLRAALLLPSYKQMASIQALTVKCCVWGLLSNVDKTCPLLLSGHPPLLQSHKDMQCCPLSSQWQAIISVIIKPSLVWIQ